MIFIGRHRIFGVVLGGLLAAVLVGCAAQAPAGGGATDTSGNKHYRIGVTVYGQGNFITQGQEGMMAYAKANNIDLLWNAANNDVNTQASQMEQLIAAGVDAIIIVPVQYDSLSTQIQNAKDKGIPVIAVNTTVKNTDLLTSSVQPDDVAAGEGTAEIMAKYLNGTGNVVILQCVLGSSYELARTKGMETVLAKYPNIKVLTKG
ncbi:MAG TPA: substrate-binding domain-containing protein, partial [Candidatus Deferrimicrobium sp.]|nr:substrate-binding domain-containing protein [Candidatus Deferrimicrobium sp.]